MSITYVWTNGQDLIEFINEAEALEHVCRVGGQIMKQLTLELK
jgi:hypothetical protein